MIVCECVLICTHLYVHTLCHDHSHKNTHHTTRDFRQCLQKSLRIQLESMFLVPLHLPPPLHLRRASGRAKRRHSKAIPQVMITTRCVCYTMHVMYVNVNVHVHVSAYILFDQSQTIIFVWFLWGRVSTIGRPSKWSGLFCKGALQNKGCSLKQT